MSIATEPLRLQKFRIEVAEGERWYIRTDDSKRIKVPDSYRDYFRLISQGASLSLLAKQMRGSLGSGLVFSRLARFIWFLDDHALLADPRLRSLAESLRPDYSWRESSALAGILDIPLLRFRARPPLNDLLRTISVALLACCAVWMFFTTIPLLSRWQTLWPAVLTNLWSPLIAFLFSFSVARSARNLLQAGLMWGVAGGEGALGIRLSLLSFSLQCEDASKIRSGTLYVLGSLLCLLSLLAPVFFTEVLQDFLGRDLAGAPEFFYFVRYFTILALLSELSPLRRSSLTEWLRAFYVEMETESGDEFSGGERVIHFFHRLLILLWVMAFGLFSVTAGYKSIMALGQLLNFRESVALVPSALLVIALTVLFGSFLDDIVNALENEFGENAGRASIRRMWGRRELLETKKGLLTETDVESLPLIRQFDSELRTLLLKDAAIVEVKAGDVICYQGDSDRSLYVVLEGSFRVMKRTSAGRRLTLAVLEAGAVFGEMAFFFGERRTATVIAVGRGRVLRVSHGAGLGDLHRGRSAELQMRIWFLQALVANSFFKSLPAEAMDALAFAGERKTYRPGEKIIAEGERGDSCYFIVQGKAKVSQNFRVINELTRGDSFGEISLLRPDLLRTATVIAETELIAVRIDQEKFWNLLVEHMALAMVLERVAEERLKKDARLKEAGRA